MRYLITITIAAIAFITGVMVQYANSDLIPNCPSEDSCAIDYQNGEWHITPEIP